MRSFLRVDAIAAASKALKDGGIVAYPTEAVYGLGCDPNNEDAICRLLALKQRPIEKGLILIAANIEQLHCFIDPEQFEKYPQVTKSWPGPHTWIIPCLSTTPLWLRGQHDALAVRVTKNRISSNLCLAFGGAIVSTSANLSDQPPARTAGEVEKQFIGKIEYILAGETDRLATVTPIRDARDGKKLR